MKPIIFVFLLLSFLSPVLAQQEGNDESIDEIEGLFKEEAEEDERNDRVRTKKQKKKDKKEDLDEISDLKSLETFDDIAVIQKRYLPKSGRFEFYLAGGTNLNDAFFVGNGVNLRFGYHITEKFGVDLLYSFIQNDNRDVTNELLKRGVNTEGSVSTNSFYGIDLRWTPIYGKYSYFNEKIIPFDLYFTLGFGMTDPNFAQSANTSTIIDVESPYTVKLGTGQIFAITKWMAFRWDLSMHFVQAETTITTGTNVSKNDELNNNLFLNVGLSFFFPEAKYR